MAAHEAAHRAHGMSTGGSDLEAQLLSLRSVSSYLLELMMLEQGTLALLPSQVGGGPG